MCQETLIVAKIFHDVEAFTEMKLSDLARKNQNQNPAGNVSHPAAHIRFWFLCVCVWYEIMKKKIKNESVSNIVCSPSRKHTWPVEQIILIHVQCLSRPCVLRLTQNMRSRVVRLWSCIVVASYAVNFNSNAGSKQGTNSSVGFLLIVIQL